MEGRGLAKGNLSQQNASGTPSREDALSALERVRQAASKDKKLRFTALLHHIYNPETLRKAYFSLKKEAAPGVDGETWRHYGETLEDNLQDLSHRLKRGAYRAKPVRRVYIDKSDGRNRPLGVPVLEDKIVQRAAVEVLNAIYETDFLGFSYGFRLGRSQHQALDALYTGLLTRKVNWVLDVDIRGFFDAISYEWLVKFVEHRIADRRVVGLIQKWLNAGVLEDGNRIRVEEGTPQGGSASPLLANVYLHYVFDLWVQARRQKRAHGDLTVVCFADDIVVGFQNKTEADQFRAELTERMKEFNLELPHGRRHLGKSRMRETRSSGSVEGVVSNHDPYFDDRWNQAIFLRAIILCAVCAISRARARQTAIGISNRRRTSSNMTTSSIGMPSMSQSLADATSTVR
jgi:group II intron reverse transcriptase/maturase